MLNNLLFTLKPVHDHLQKIHLLIDTSYIQSKTQQAVFLEQLKLLEQFIFLDDYKKHVQVLFYYFNGFKVEVLDSHRQTSLSSLIDAKGLPKVAQAIEMMSQQATLDKDTLPTKPWLFFFVHGFSIQNTPLPMFESLLKQNFIFSRGFLLSNDIKLDRLLELTPRPGFLKVIEDKLEYPLAFIFQQAKSRVETPIQQGLSLPSTDFFKIWSVPLGK
jgi:hypothetical protein